MAIYRQIYMSFWTDTKVDEEFTPEEKYFYLYLMTNPHTNICGCYECGMKQMARETGYNEDTIKRLLDRMESTHDVIRYDYSTKEVLILNWYKYNFTSSADTIKGVVKTAEHIKSDRFKEYVFMVIEAKKNHEDVVSFRESVDGVEGVYGGSIDRVQTSVTDTVTDTVCYSDNKVNGKNEADVLFDGLSDTLKAAAKEWFEYKKEKRQAYKPTGAKKLISQIMNASDKYGEKAVIEVMEKSMASNYQGIMFDWLNKGSYSKKSEPKVYDYNEKANEEALRHFYGE